MGVKVTIANVQYFDDTDDVYEAVKRAKHNIIFAAEKSTSAGVTWNQLVTDVRMQRYLGGERPV